MLHYCTIKMAKWGCESMKEVWAVVRGSEVAWNLAELRGSKGSKTGSQGPSGLLPASLTPWHLAVPQASLQGRADGGRGGCAAVQGDTGLSVEKCQVLPCGAALCAGTGWRNATGFSRLLSVPTFGRLPFGWLASCLLGFSPVLCTRILNPAPSSSSACTNGWCLKLGHVRMEMSIVLILRKSSWDLQLYLKPASRTDVCIALHLHQGWKQKQ